MPRRPNRTIGIGKRVRVVILPRPANRISLARRVHSFVAVHQKPIGVVVVLSVAFLLVLVHERQIAAITAGSVLEKAVDVFLDIMTDRVFPGGEFTKEV